MTENAVSGACPTQPCNVVTQYQYDRADNRIAIIDPRANRRRFTYDAANEQKQAIDALGFTTVYTYDQLGRLTNQQDPRGGSYNLTFSYDGLEQITQTMALQLRPPIHAPY